MKAKGFFLLFYFTTKVQCLDPHENKKKETKETIKIGKYWKLNVSFIILLQSTMPWTHMYALILSNPNMVDFLAADFDLLSPYSISFFFLYYLILVISFQLLTQFTCFSSHFIMLLLLILFIYLFLKTLQEIKRKAKKIVNWSNFWYDLFNIHIYF